MKVFLGLWDALVLGLIVFPWLTGGTRLKWSGHFTLEVSELGSMTVLMALIALLLKKGMRVPLEQSWTSRQFFRLWQGWSEGLARSPGVLLSGAGGLAGLLWSLVALNRHWSLHTRAFDVGIFANALWNLTHGFGYVSSPKDGMNLFADHQSPILWLIAPIYAAIPRAETLLVLQAFGLAAGAIPLYFIARQYLGGKHWACGALPWIYWSYLPIRNANAFEFHPEVLLLPLFLAAIAGIQSSILKNRFWAVPAFVLALMCKESAGPVAAGVGLGWILGAGPENTRSFTRRMGLAWLLIGALVFWFDIRVVPRIFGDGKYAYGHLFSQYGDSLADLILAPFRKPEYFFSHILNGARRTFLLGCLLPLGFLPLLNPRASVAALPGFLMLFMSEGDSKVDLIFHYGIEPSVGLLWAMPGAIATLNRFFPSRSPWPVLIVLFFTLGGTGRTEVYRIRRYIPSDYARWVRKEVIPGVAPGVSIAATDSYVPYLVNRRWVHRLESLVVQPSGALVDCVINDFGAPDLELPEEDRKKFRAQYLSLGYREAWSCRSIHVFQRGAPCMIHPPVCVEKLNPGEQGH